MDFLDVLAVLNDVPSTFKREAPPYTQFTDSVATALTRFTTGVDATTAQVRSFEIAVDGWLDVWGLLWNIPRNENEANASYAARIQETVLAWVGTLPALQAWTALFASGGTVAENLSGIGYLITLPALLTADQVQAFIFSLKRIRPAGVPFQVEQIGGGLFADTDEFTHDTRVMGNYLSTGTSLVPITDATTLSYEPLLPDLLLVDPTLNPSLTG